MAEQGELFGELGSLFCEVELLPLTPREEIRFEGRPLEGAPAGELELEGPTVCGPATEADRLELAAELAEWSAADIAAVEGRPSEAELATPAERREMFETFGWTR